MIKQESETPLPLNFKDTVSIIVSETNANGINIIINVGTSLCESNNSVLLAHEFKNVYAVVGIHPNDITSSWKEDIKHIKKWLTQAQEKKIVGIGECGIDLFHKNTPLSLQQDVFKTHIELALQHELALVVHSRNAYEETLRVIEPYATEIKRGVFHCFSYDQAFAQQAISWDFMLGIGGTLTYPKNDVLRSVVTSAPLTCLVLETDAPFLPVQTMRGKKNHPQYIATIAQQIALCKNISPEQVALQTTNNALKLFNLAPSTIF
jgi:TatD DNase family protein